MHPAAGAGALFASTFSMSRSAAASRRRSSASSDWTLSSRACSCVSRLRRSFSLIGCTPVAVRGGQLTASAQVSIRHRLFHLTRSGPHRRRGASMTHRSRRSVMNANRRLWIGLGVLLVVSFSVLIVGRHGNSPRDAADTGQGGFHDGRSRSTRAPTSRRAGRSGSPSVASSSVRSGDTAATSRRTGAPTGCIAKRLAWLDRDSLRAARRAVRRTRRRAAGSPAVAR